MNRRRYAIFVVGILTWGLGTVSLTEPARLGAAPLQQAGPAVARVFFAEQAKLDRLAHELDIWEMHHPEEYLATWRADQHAHLQRTGYGVEIDKDKAALLDPPSERLPFHVSDIPGYPCYRTVEEIYTALSQLASAHPDLASWVDIGDSWDKATPGGSAGYDLFALVLSNKSRPGPKPRFFLMAATHGKELATADLATRFAERLMADYGSDPDVTWLVDYNEVHIVPIVNPDGRKLAEQGNAWRKNTDNDDGCTTFPDYGTDLNRNNDFHWGGSSADPCNENYQGPSANSEPETQAIQNYVASIFPDQRGSGDDDPAPDNVTGVLITLHSYGGHVLFPYWFRPTASPNNRQLETLGRKFGYFNGYAVCQGGEPGCFYAATGTIDDWAYGQLGVAAYVFELGTAFFQDCSTFEGTLLPQNLPALIYAFKSARQPFRSPAGPESLQVTVVPTSVIPGTLVMLTAVADDTRYNSNGWGTELTQTVVAARYTVDTPSWITGSVAYSMSPSDGVFDGSVEDIQAAVDTAGWTPGRHLMFIESQDAAGNWGAPSAVFVHIMKDYEVALAPTAATGLAFPGHAVSYTLQLTNMGYMSDTFDILAGGNVWPVTVPDSVGPLGPRSSASLTVTVSIPDGATDGATDTVIITATSRSDAAELATARLTTAVKFYAVVVKPAASLKSADPGTPVTHTLRVTNTGNAADTFNVTVTGNAWTVGVVPTLGPLAATSGANLRVRVNVPQTALAGATDTARVTLVSQGDPAQSATSALTTTANLVRGVAVKPSAAALSGDPGAPLTYTLRVTNTGNAADTFSVTVTGNAWTTELTPTVGPLAARAGADLRVRVNVPQMALAGATDTARVTLVSRGDPARSATSALTTTANLVRGVVVTPSAAALSGDPGTPLTYTLRVTNTGNAADTFNVTVTGNAWTVGVVPILGPLAARTGADLQVRVNVSETALAGAADTARVAFVSQGDPARSATSALTTTANLVRGVVVTPSAAALSGDPGTPVTYTLRVTNTGNAADTFSVTVTGNAWTTELVSTVELLAARTGADLQVRVNVSETAPAGATDTARVALVSQGDPARSATSALTTTANLVRGVVVTPSAAALSDDPGTPVTYTLQVTNTGNAADTFSVTVTGNAWTTELVSTVGPLAARTGADLQVRVNVPQMALAGAADMAQVTLVSQGDPARSATSALTTTANTVYGVVIEPMMMKGSGYPGETVVYTLRFTNTGNTTETFALSYLGNTWDVRVQPAISATLRIGTGNDLTAYIMIPPTVTHSMTDVVLVKVTTADVFKVSGLTTQATWRVYLPLVTTSP